MNVKDLALVPRRDSPETGIEIPPDLWKALMAMRPGEMFELTYMGRTFAMLAKEDLEHLLDLAALPQVRKRSP